MPSPEHSDLWQKLQNLDLDGDAVLPFSKRLARDNGWSHDFALRVVDELKRFYFLAATCGHPVTPSDEVDQAWHLHLVYTRSYWDELCGEILGFPLHHGPTKGGKSEGDKFVNWYDKTLASYLAAFEEEPPRDIWPDASIRFGEAPYFRRVNVRRVWMVRKPFAGAPYKGANSQHSLQHLPLPARFAAVLLLLLFAGCAAPSTWNAWDWSGEEFLGAFWTACAIGLVWILFLRWRMRRPLEAVPPTTPLDAYEVARLKDGETWAVDVALASLQARGALEVTPGGEVCALDAPSQLHPFERAVFEALKHKKHVHALQADGKSGALSVPLVAIDQKLCEAGLLLSSKSHKEFNRVSQGITSALSTVGLLRMIVGIARDKPIGFLAVTCIAIVVFGFCLYTNPPRRTKRGDVLLKNLTATHVRPPMRSFRLEKPHPIAVPSEQRDGEATALYFALAGLAAFPPNLRMVVAPTSSGGGDGGGGSSSGDGGGGGCGGGCGGCGGS